VGGMGAQLPPTLSGMKRCHESSRNMAENVCDVRFNVASPVAASGRMGQCLDTAFVVIEMVGGVVAVMEVVAVWSIPPSHAGHSVHWLLSLLSVLPTCFDAMLKVLDHICTPRAACGHHQRQEQKCSSRDLLTRWIGRTISFSLTAGTGFNKLTLGSSPCLLQGRAHTPSLRHSK
jgi:hypothetical protein